MSGFEQLERQLTATIAERDPGRAPRPAPSRFRRRRPLLAVIAALVLTGSGAAALATAIHSPESIAKQARKVEIGAVSRSFRQHQHACDMEGFDPNTPVQLTNAAVLPGIATRMPVVTHRSDPADFAKALAVLHQFRLAGKGPVIASSLHFIPTSKTLAAFVFVQLGDAGFHLIDPAACEAVRFKYAAELSKDRDPAVLAAAKARLAKRFEVVHGEQQSLTIGSLPRSVLDHPTRPLSGGFGSSTGIYAAGASYPHAQAPYGLMSSGGNGYLGVASPRAARILLHATRKAAAHRIPKSVPVVDGFWTMKLPSGTGRIRLTEVTATGSALRVMHIRGRCGGCASLK